jgi:rare lipoprotein A
VIRAVAVSALTAGACVLAGCAGSLDEGPPPQAPMAQPAWQAPPGGIPAAAWSQAPYQQGRASYYADRLAGRRTATGEPYDPAAYTAAHRTLPLGSFVDVARADGRHVVVRINDRGPFAHGRIIDLSRRAATDLGMVRAGVVDVVLRVLWVPPAKPKRM